MGPNRTLLGLVAVPPRGSVRNRQRQRAYWLAGDERERLMNEITGVPGAYTLSQDEGRKLLDERLQDQLHITLDEFERKYDADELDLEDSLVRHFVLLLPFARSE